MNDLRVHMIADDELMNELSIAIKLVPIPTVLAQLKDSGRQAAEAFLQQHRIDLGVTQTSTYRQFLAETAASAYP